MEGTEVAEKLNIAGLRGLVALGRFDKFRAAIVDDLPGLDTDARRDLSAHALQRAVETADDEQFLKAELGLSRLAPPSAISPSGRLLLAHRLVEMGLAHRAEKYIPDALDSIDALSVAVDVMIDMDQPGRAVALISESTVPERDRLLGMALSAAGQARDATYAFAAVGEETKAVETALQNADWDWIEEHGEAPFAEAAAVLRVPLLRPDAELEAPNGTLIEGSRARRSQIELLLEATSATQALTN